MLAEVRAADPGRGLPRHVERELDAYLRCGILAHDLARVHCQWVLSVDAPGHRPRPDRGPGLDQLRVTYRELGDGADDFLAALERAQPRSAAYYVRRILACHERYQTGDVLAAMDHARHYGTFKYHASERILD